MALPPDNSEFGAAVSVERPISASSPISMGITSAAIEPPKFAPSPLRGHSPALPISTIKP
jgi:hypothetical protein